MKARVRKKLKAGADHLVQCILALEGKPKDKYERSSQLHTAGSKAFLALENFLDALMLREYGEYSKKHKEDLGKYEEMEKKYGWDINLKGLYKSAYGVRMFSDYRDTEKVKVNREVIVDTLEGIKVILESLGELSLMIPEVKYSLNRLKQFLVD